MQPEKRQNRGSAGGKAAAAARRRQLARVLDAFGTEPTCALALSKSLGIPNLWVLARELERIGLLMDLGDTRFVRCSKWQRSDGTGPELCLIYGGRSSAPPAATALAQHHDHGRRA